MPASRRDGVTSASNGHQGPAAPERHASGATALVGLALWIATALGGCTDIGTTAVGGALSPVDWWHGLEGGRIAETRPPPPNADAPYPRLATVPSKPPGPDAAAHGRIITGLIADRTNAQQTQAASPIVLPATTLQAHNPPPAAPDKPADGDQLNAVLPAASAPPPAAPTKPPPPAPIAAVPPPAPAGAAAAPPAPPPVAAAAAPPIQAAAADAPMPSIPDSPPPPAQLPLVADLPVVTAPPAPAPAPPPQPPAAVRNGPVILVPFAAGSAVLQAQALPTVKSVVAKRGTSSVVVIGFGEASAGDPAAQTAALPLALDRARAVAAQLLVAGIPATAIRIAAEPQGSGAAMRLVD